ncbi:hypothetical protein MB02_14450 [Croceicoccus estronivorus]|uniref:acyl-CoA dehydrogenase family protein n=1 Tax=Croceicoccus estronivorus TaxID=1172626 RepID=UPI00082EBB7B|nr:acyl-CoA dehydrogenase family protein [Croceicoccus estronivorus]OCC22961.1 hypothetical protein MB02_14450 [Croceicoccus estronivorus]
MQFELSPECEAFRREMQAQLRAMVPADMARRTRQRVHPTKDDLKLWNRLLNEKGWAAPHWPQEFGGTGWDPLLVHIFEEECAAADAPFPSYFGLRLVGPLLYTFGSQEHRDRYLPTILSGDIFWCQGFSEPSSGSDLASLRTRAYRDGDEWIVEGGKLWTTEAHFADKMLLLARTNPDVRPQRGGLSMFILDMNAPGVTRRPVITIDEGHSVNEIFFDSVRLPADALLGEEGEGWTYAKFLLAHERITNAHVPRNKRDVRMLRTIASEECDGGQPMVERPDIAEALARLEIDVAALEWSVLRELNQPSGNPAIASGLKILASEIQQRITDLAVDLVGPAGLVFYDEAAIECDDPAGDVADYVPGLAARQLFYRATTIYAGSNEIQRGIIARQAFGY